MKVQMEYKNILGMKKTISILCLAVLIAGLSGSCTKINGRIDDLEKRVSGIESEQIASVKTQLQAINLSISDLGTIRKNVQDLMKYAPTKEVMEELRKADATLGLRIDELRAYTDDNLRNYATTEWVLATFATLEQHQWTCDTIAGIDERIGKLDTKLASEIADCISSLKSWVNGRLDEYYTAARIDAKLGAMQSEIDALKDKTGKADIDSLAAELTKVKVAVDTAKANIRREYKAAVKSAIETSEGKLTTALRDSIDKVNVRITALDTRVAALESAVDALTGRVDALEKMIQTVTIIPAYSDGSVKAEGDELELNFIVSPANAVKGLKKENVRILTNEALTKAVSIDTVKTISSFTVDEARGTVEIKADISGNLPADAGNALTVAVNVCNGISDFTTGFVPVYFASDALAKTQDTSSSSSVQNVWP